MNFVAHVSIALIRAYQRILSFDTGLIGKLFPRRTPVCAFYPTCSEYAVRAIEKYGAGTGWLMTIRRVSHCHPWQKPTIDEP